MISCSKGYEKKTACGSTRTILPGVVYNGSGSFSASPSWEEKGFVFTTHQGGYLYPQTLYTAYFKPLRDRTAVPPIHFHDLRHTYTTLALLNDIPVKVVSEVLGHKDISTTLRTYAHVLPGMGKEAAKTMNAVLF